MPCRAVEAVEIGVRAALIGDALAEPEQLVKTIDAESVEALPFGRDLWHAGHYQSSARRAP
jgi:hypothetical protein